jgi:DNA-binding beta-propeller fold protein YncE
VVLVKGGQMEELGRGLADPHGVAVGEDGAIYVSEAGAGRVSKLVGGRAETVVDGLQLPHGIAVHGGRLYVVDAVGKTVTEQDLASGARSVVASNLPVGAPPGVTPKRLNGFPPFVGPMGPFSGLAAGPDGTLYVGADGDGSILALRPQR